MNHIESNAVKAVVLIVLLIPLLISGNTIYKHFSNVSSTNTNVIEKPSQEDTTENVKGDLETTDEDVSVDQENTNVSSNVKDETSRNDEIGNKEKINKEAESPSEGESSKDNNVVAEEDTTEVAVVDNGKSIETVNVSEDAYNEESIKILKDTYLTLYFESQSFKINNGNREDLERFIDVANQFPKEAISIEGHANGYPNFENSILEQAVSSDRSEAIKDMLLDNGIEDERITIYNCGSSQPLSLDENEQALNDRVEIYFRDFNAKGNKDK